MFPKEINNKNTYTIKLKGSNLVPAGLSKWVKVTKGHQLTRKEKFHRMTSFLDLGSKYIRLMEARNNVVRNVVLFYRVLEGKNIVGVTFLPKVELR